MQPPLAFAPSVPLPAALVAANACCRPPSTSAAFRVCVTAATPLRPRSAAQSASHAAANPPPAGGPEIARVVLICGFETFNLATYKASAAALAPAGVRVSVFTDNQLDTDKPRLLRALRDADAVLCSLLFDYDQVEWLVANLPRSAVVFVFESALELMSTTRVGSFTMGSASASASLSNRSKQAPKMPDAVRLVLQKLGLVGREEDKFSSYLALLKSASRLLSLVPGRRARDLKNWLTVYQYWNASGTSNVSAMLRYIAQNVLNRPVQGEIEPVVQIPNFGVLHPLCDDYFEHPRAYVDWYFRTFPDRVTWPVVAVLLYRKHVVSKLKYIEKLVRLFEEQGIVPVPVFITGVEAHIMVRDYLTSVFKEESRKEGKKLYGSDRRGKTAAVDAVVSTIGYVRCLCSHVAPHLFRDEHDARFCKDLSFLSNSQLAYSPVSRWSAARPDLWPAVETQTLARPSCRNSTSRMLSPPPC